MFSVADLHLSALRPCLGASQAIRAAALCEPPLRQPILALAALAEGRQIPTRSGGRRMPQHINVTQEIIDGAVTNTSSRCMVADAVKKAFPRAVRIRVDMQTIRWTDPAQQKRYVYLTPARAQQYIIAFDAGDTIKPFRFRLDRQGRQIIPMVQMTPEVQKALHEKTARLKVKRSSGGSVVEKIGGKAPPLGPSTTRGFGVRGLRVN